MYFEDSLITAKKKNPLKIYSENLESYSTALEKK